MAAGGHQAEEALHKAMKDNEGKYLLIVDGSIPLGLDGAYSCIAGKSNLETLKEVAKGAAAIVAMGSCAAFGGIPKANPNPKPGGRRAYDPPAPDPEAPKEPPKERPESDAKTEPVDAVFDEAEEYPADD